jgi:hypothetical protein
MRSCEQTRYIILGNGPREQVALQLITPHRSKGLPLILCLNSLCRYRQPQRMAESHDSCNDRNGVLVGGMPDPITRLRRLMAASTRARRVYPDCFCQPMRPCCSMPPRSGYGQRPSRKVTALPTGPEMNTLQLDAKPFVQ